MKSISTPVALLDERYHSFRQSVTGSCCLNRTVIIVMAWPGPLTMVRVCKSMALSTRLDSMAAIMIQVSNEFLILSQVRRALSQRQPKGCSGRAAIIIPRHCNHYVSAKRWEFRKPFVPLWTQFHKANIVVARTVTGNIVVGSLKILLQQFQILCITSRARILAPRPEWRTGGSEWRAAQHMIVQPYISKLLCPSVSVDDNLLRYW